MSVAAEAESSMPQSPSPALPPALPSSLLDAWLATSRRAADAAAAVHAAWAKRIDIRGADEKSFSDFVSRVDVEAQEAAIGVITREWPEHAIMAEEEEAAHTAVPTDGTPLWVVDPLDGTTNFLHDHPNYCASVAVTVDGEPLAGCITCAPTGERWWARKGGGAFRSGRAIRVSPIERIDQSLMATGFMFRGTNQVERFAREIVAVRSSGAGIRRGGAAAMDLCYVADGRFEGYWEGFLNPWDYAAGVLIVREAGGVVTRADGSPIGLEPGSIMAANSDEMAAKLLALLEADAQV